MTCHRGVSTWLGVAVVVVTCLLPLGMSRASERNSCGCYQTDSGACICDKKAKCGCPGACEPQGCEERRDKALQKGDRARNQEGARGRQAARGRRPRDAHSRPGECARVGATAPDARPAARPGQAAGQAARISTWGGAPERAPRDRGRPARSDPARAVAARLRLEIHPDRRASVLSRKCAVAPRP